MISEVRNRDMKELTDHELDQVAGGEVAPTGNAAPTQIATQGDAGSSPDWSVGRSWCFLHPYACRK